MVMLNDFMYRKERHLYGDIIVKNLNASCINERRQLNTNLIHMYFC